MLRAVYKSTADQRGLYRLPVSERCVRTRGARDNKAACTQSRDCGSFVEGLQKFAPLYQDAAKAYRHRVGSRWSVDETYVKVAGRWGYVYRAIDEHGQVVEVLFREHRDTEAATAFFRAALENTGGGLPTVCQ